MLNKSKETGTKYVEIFEKNVITQNNFSVNLKAFKTRLKGLPGWKMEGKEDFIGSITLGEFFCGSFG
jgi:hypothetical protein